MDEQLPLAEIPSGFFEYRTTFKEPIFTAWYDKETLIASVYKALSPWGIDLEKITWNANAKHLKEASVSFSVTSLPVTVHVGVGGLAIIDIAADWSQVSALASLFRAILETLKNLGAQELNAQETVLGFHVSPGPRPFREIMRQFVNADALGLEGSEMFGLVSYGGEVSLLLDRSVNVPQGLFVRMTRVFPPATEFDEMASILWQDEESLVRRLGFRVQ